MINITEMLQKCVDIVKANCYTITYKTVGL